MRCRTFALEETENYQYVVVFSRFRGEWLFSRHRARRTWETQGGHIEAGESPEDAAKRELWEESGAEEFVLTPVCGYGVTRDEGAQEDYGAVFFAEITKRGALPDSEMAETGLFAGLPGELTYPEITPVLWERMLEAVRQDL